MDQKGIGRIMKAEIKADMYIHIFAETIYESLSLQLLGRDSKVCPECGTIQLPIIVHTDSSEKANLKGGD